MKAFLRAYDRLTDALANIAAYLVVIIMLIVVYGVFMRYVPNKPQTWILEISQNSLLLMTMLVAAWVLRQKAHTRMDFLSDRVSPKVSATVMMWTSVFCAAACLVFAVFGVRTTVIHFQRHILAPTVLELPTAPFLLFIPLGMLLLGIQFIRDIFTFNDARRAVSAKQQAQVSGPRE